MKLFDIILKCVINSYSYNPNIMFYNAFTFTKYTYFTFVCIVDKIIARLKEKTSSQWYINSSL